MHNKFTEFLTEFQLDKNLIPLVKKQLEITWYNTLEANAGEQKSMVAKLSELNNS